MAAAVTAALTCLLMGTAATGCGVGTNAEERSADEMFDDANDAMSALKSVRIEFASTPAKGGKVTTRLVTNLHDRCRATMKSSEGGTLEQIRIGDTDYVRPDRAYLRKWNGHTSLRAEQNQWIKSPADESADSGLVSCAWPFGSFGKVKKGNPTRIDGRDALALTVTDKADKGGRYTFYIATQGKPFLLRTVYQGSRYQTTTSFGAFDAPLGIRPPKETEVLDMTDVTR